jgi:predicted ribosomally synthesized peptide with SipW-like signal peptide
LVVRIRNNQRLVALCAAGLVLFAGSTVTSLAAWTDTEWVNGTVATLPAVTATTFDVEQNVNPSPSNAWTTNLASPGGTVSFGTEAAKLTPGASVLGFVRLRTVTASLGATLTLAHGASTGSAAFLSALRMSAWLMPDPSTCTDADYNGPASTQLVPAGSAIGADSTVPFTLAAGDATDPGAEKTVCFRLTFPTLATPGDTALQGQAADPVWQFNATSN